MKPEAPHARTLKDVLHRSPHFASITPQITKLRTLHQQLAESLDPALLQQCQVADFKEGMLTLIVTSPALAHRFRFLGAELVATLRRQSPWQSLRTLRTLVRSPEPLSLASNPPRDSHTLGLSPQSAHLLKNAANTVASPALQEALQRLSKHLS